MSDQPDDTIMAYLRRMDAKLDRALVETSEIKAQLNHTHLAVLAVQRDRLRHSETVAHLQVRVDRFEDDLARIKRRLDIVD